MKAILLVICLFIGLVANAVNLDSLAQIVKKQPKNEEAIIEWMDVNLKQRNFELMDSLAATYLEAPGFSDSFYATMKNHYASASLLLKSDFEVTLKRFYPVLKDTIHLSSRLTKGIICQNVGYLFHQLGVLDSTTLFYSKALKYYASLTNDNYRFYQVSISLSMINRSLGKHAEALETLSSIRNTVTGVLDSQQIIQYYGAISAVYSSMNLTDSAIFYYSKAISNAKTCENYLLVAIYAGNISQMYSNVDQNKEALRYAKMGLRNRKLSGDLRNIAYSYIAMGRAYQGLKLLDSAKRSYNQVLQSESTSGRSIALNNLGSIYLDLDMPDSSLYFFNEALKDIRKRNYTKGLLSSFLGKSDAFMRQKKYGESKDFLDSSYSELLAFNDFRNYAYYYKLLCEYNMYKNNPLSAIKALELMKDYRDSFLTKERNSRIDGLRIVYEVEQKQAKIKSLAQENLIKDLKLGEERANSKNQKLIIASVVVAAILLLLGLVFQRRFATKFKNLSKQLAEKNKEINAKNQQLDVVNKEIYHRTKNHMQTMASVIGLQKDVLAEGKAKDVLAENEHRLNAMGLMHKKLFKQDPFAPVGLQSFVEELIKDLAFAFNQTQNFSYQVELSNIAISPNSIIPLSLALNECFTNAFKYAFKNHQAPKLSISGSQNAALISIEIKDNGPGFQQSATDANAGSFGLELIKSMAIQLEGEVTFSTNNGAIIQLKFNDKQE